MSITLTRATKVVPLCVNLDLKGEHDRAVQALADAKNEAARDARENSTLVRDAAQAVVDLEQQMRDHTLLFTLQARPRKEWAEFVAGHPPRPGNEYDKSLDLDVSALDEVIQQSIIKVESRAGESLAFDGPAEWQRLADDMSDGQWTEFALAILAVNRGSTRVPFSPAASLAIQRSEQSSKRPNASE